MNQRSVLQSDYDQLQRDRDNWKVTSISAIERAEKAEAEVERLMQENSWMRSRGLDRAWDKMCLKDDDRGRLVQAIHREHDRAKRAEAEVERLRKLMRKYYDEDRNSMVGVSSATELEVRAALEV